MSDLNRLGGESCAVPLLSIVEVAFGLVCAAGETIGRTVVGSNSCSTKRLEKFANVGSSGKRSFMRFSSLTIWFSSP